MRVAVVHYHLRGGGVSRVIQHAVAALPAAEVRAAVLVGAPPPRGVIPAERVAVVAGLDYADASEAPSPALLADRLESAARDALGGPPDLWHAHNPRMGKNGALTAALRLLAQRGCRLLLQIHDFAEDGRPALFRSLLSSLADGNIEALGRCLYPRAAHIHYATINGRDAAILENAGVPAERLHRLPNAATLDVRAAAAAPWTPAPAGPRRVLYPVRAIRRKNLGEFLLWAACADPDTRFAVTLAPTSPADRTAYDAWKAFARDRRLPVDFEVGMADEASFEERLAQAWAAATTSIAEGFGLTFLEPWLLNRPVVGRRLPEITADVESAGVDLSGLYDRLDVPTDWLDTRALRARLVRAYTDMLSAYARRPGPGDIERAVAATLTDGMTDFGRLDEPAQAAVIEGVRRDAGRRDCLRPNRLVTPTSGAAMETNRRVVETRYSLASYGARLRDAYRRVADSPIGPIDGGMDIDRLLDAFLSPERFNLLRT